MSPYHHRHSDSPAGRLGRILHLQSVGTWVALVDGQLLEIAGSCCWENEEQLRAAAARRGVALAEQALFTGRLRAAA